MAEILRSFPGSCHCGNLKVVYETAVAPAETEVRACACGFCRRHGSLAVSDPAGRLKIAVEDPTRLNRYRFALGTADFLICADCGVYAAAVLAEGDRAWAIVNTNVLDDRTAFSRTPTAFDFDGEDQAGRVDRRKTRWTPLVA